MARAQRCFRLPLMPTGDSEHQARKHWLLLHEQVPETWLHPLQRWTGTVLFQHDVAATLPIHNPASFDESSHGRCPRTDRERRAHATRISISIVSMFDGIELAARVSRLPSIASRMFAMASSRVLPCETQPGRPGHLATNQPSSSCSRVTKNFCDFATAPTVVPFCRAAKSLLCRLRGRAGRGARLLQLRRWKV